jgi:hypothetical protein
MGAGKFGSGITVNSAPSVPSIAPRVTAVVRPDFTTFMPANGYLIPFAAPKSASWVETEREVSEHTAQSYCLFQRSKNPSASAAAVVFGWAIVSVF